MQKNIRFDLPKDEKKLKDHLEKENKIKDTFNDQMKNLRSRIYPFVIPPVVTIVTSLVVLLFNKSSFTKSGEQTLQNSYLIICELFLILIAIYTIYELIREIMRLLDLKAI